MLLLVRLFFIKTRNPFVETKQSHCYKRNSRRSDTDRRMRRAIHHLLRTDLLFLFVCLFYFINLSIYFFRETIGSSSHGAGPVFFFISSRFSSTLSRPKETGSFGAYVPLSYCRGRGVGSFYLDLFAYRHYNSRPDESSTCRTVFSAANRPVRWKYMWTFPICRSKMHGKKQRPSAAARYDVFLRF